MTVAFYCVGSALRSRIRGNRRTSKRPSSDALGIINRNWKAQTATRVGFDTISIDQFKALIGGVIQVNLNHSLCIRLELMSSLLTNDLDLDAS